METKMRNLAVCAAAVGLFGAATLAMAQTASPNRSMASPTAADPAVRARVMASIKAAPAPTQRSGEAVTTPSRVIGPAIAAASSIPITGAKPPK
jgi:hypothetical protein